MSLYLCIFADEDDNEIEGVEVGFYSDFSHFRRTVADRLERGQSGRRFPTLMNQSDSDGQWSFVEASKLESELLTIADEFAQLPPQLVDVEWQQDLRRELGIQATNLLDSFIDVDGEVLLDRLVNLARTSAQVELDISFQ